MKHKITIIRHGMTQGNLDRTYTGKTDVPLCQMGIDGILAKVEQYPPCDLLITSDLQRARQTAKLIYPDKEPLIVPNIRECDMGDFEGKTYDELKENADYQRFLDPNDGFVPGGESLQTFNERCHKGFLEVVALVEKHGAKQAAVVSHGGVIMSVMNGFSDEQKIFFDYQTKNGGGYIIEFDTDTQKIEILDTLA